MAVKPITKATVLRRREQVAELYIRGQTQCEIATALGVSQPTVSLDLKSIQQNWRESAIFDFNLAVGREQLKLEHLEREAWKGWERSGGRTLAEVRDAAGHSNVAVTSAYLHVGAEDEAGGRDLFDRP